MSWYSRTDALNIITEESGLQAVHEDMSVDDLGDSLERISLVQILEEEYGFEATDGEIDRLKTVGDVLEMIERHVKPTTGSGSTDAATKA